MSWITTWLSLGYVWVQPFVICWLCLGSSLCYLVMSGIISWLSVGYVWDHPFVIWLCLGSYLGYLLVMSEIIPWLSVGYVWDHYLVISWLCLGHPLVICWLCLGSSLGYLLVVSGIITWLSLGYVWDIPWLSLGHGAMGTAPSRGPVNKRQGWISTQLFLGKQDILWCLTRGKKKSSENCLRRGPTSCIIKYREAHRCSNTEFL